MFTMKRYTEEHIEQSIEFLHESYIEEKTYHVEFFIFDHDKNILYNNLLNLIKHSNYNYALYDDDQFIGFICGFVIPSLWGKFDGYYSPLYGNSVKKKYRKKGYQFLYEHLSQELVKNNILSHAITLYTNDDISMNTWFHLGFGLRLIDSFKSIDFDDSFTLPSTLKIHKITKRNTEDFLSLHKNLHFYFEQAPLFMPQFEEDEEQEMINFIDKPNHYMYGLYFKDKAVAFMKLRETGENFLTQDEHSIHICGLYVDKDIQRNGIASILLKYVENECHKMGYSILGVDFESFNIKGANF